MKAWLKWLATAGLGIFITHEAQTIAEDFHPHDAPHDPGISSYTAPEPPTPPHLLDERLPAAPPPPPFPPELAIPATSQQGQLDPALIAHWIVQRNRHYHAANLAAFAGSAGVPLAAVPIVVNPAASHRVQAPPLVA